MIELRIILENAPGVFERQAAIIVETANRFEADVHIRNGSTGSECEDGKTFLRVTGLKIVKGQTIEIRVDGLDELEAIGTLERLVNEGFRGPASGPHRDEWKRVE